MEALEVATELGVSVEAVQMAHEFELVDLHIDTFITVRLFGYDLEKRHGLGPLRGQLFGHLDLPRLEAGGLSGGMWSITTNPLRGAKGRWSTFQKNLTRLRALIQGSGGRLAIARTHAEYQAARNQGAHACMISVQGGNCFEAAPDGVASLLEREVTRVTVVHLTNSCYGATSAPSSSLRRNRGLTSAGRGFVEQLNAARVFVDLAHIHPDGFWDAVDAHDGRQPLIDTHTGVDGVRPHWRNLDDEQLKAIAKTGGVVGIIFQVAFLNAPGRPTGADIVVEHMQHIIDVVGEDHVAIGSDYDGAILPPPGLEGADSYPRLVQAMLERGYSETRIRKILGGNFLRAFAELRP